MKRKFCQKSAAFLLALCIGSTGLPRLGVGESLTEPAVTAYAADSQVTLNETTGELVLDGSIKKEDVTAFAENAKVKKVTCASGTIFPADCSEMFQFFKATEFNLTKADTSAVTDMSCMFNTCQDVKTIDLTGWDTSKVTTMYEMFNYCSALETIYVGVKWSTASVTNFAEMFDSCDALTGDKGTVYNAANEDKDYARIDLGADNPGYLSHHHVWGEWVYTKYARCGEGGEGEQERICSICGDKDTRLINPPAEEHSWGTPTYTWTGYTECTAERRCNNCGEKETETAEATETETGVYTAEFTNPAFTTQKKLTSGLPPVYGTYCWEPDEPLTQEGVYSMSQDFGTGGPETRGLEVSSIKAREGCVLPKDCKYLFHTTGHPLDWRCLTSIDLSAADFSQVENMENMFTGMPKLTTVILNGVDLKNVQNMTKMFYDCPMLSTVKLVITDGTPNLVSTEALFSDWGTISELTLKGITGESLQNTSRMFSGNYYLDNVNFVNIDLSFDTSKVEDMSEMFSGLSGVTKLDLSGFNTSSVDNMKNMFAGCSGLTKLDLSSFDTSKVEDMSGMFSGCESLKSITVSKGWSTEKVDESDEMFLDCQKLKGMKGTVYDAEHTDAEYARADSSLAPGYFTATALVTPYPAVAATCEEPGNIAYWYDEITNTYYKDEALTQEIKLEDTVVPALGHKWSEWKVKPATCTEDGSKTRTCENCQKTETETIKALGHIWGEWEVTKNVTCTEDGIRKHTCETCKETVSEVIPALGGEHEWSDWKVTKKPTCVEDGEQMRSCSKCGEKQILPVAATGEHTWGDWVTVTEATYTTEGLKKHVCSVCGEEETEVIPMLVSSSANLVIGQIDKATAEILSEKTDLEKLSAYIIVAKASYEDLAEGEKALITNYNDLLIAEKYYNAMKASADSAELLAALEQANADLAAAKASAAELSKQLETAQADLAAAQEALEAANTDLAAANKTVTDLTAQLKSANEKIDALEAGAEADELLQKEVSELKTQLEAAKIAQASAEADAKTAKANAEKAAAAQASAEAAQAKAEAAQAKAEKELAELKASIGHKIVKVGDVDGDGTVDNKDSMLLSRYVGGWEDIELDLDAADLDRDGKVDVRDAMILSRYVAAWEGYDKYIIEVEK